MGTAPTRVMPRTNLLSVEELLVEVLVEVDKEPVEAPSTGTILALLLFARECFASYLKEVFGFDCLTDGMVQFFCPDEAYLSAEEKYSFTSVFDTDWCLEDLLQGGIYVPTLLDEFKRLLWNVKSLLSTHEITDVAGALDQDSRFGGVILMLMVYDITCHSDNAELREVFDQFQTKWKAFDQRGFREQLACILKWYLLLDDLYLESGDNHKWPTVASAIKAAELEVQNQKLKVATTFYALRHHIPKDVRLMLVEGMRGLF